MNIFDGELPHKKRHRRKVHLNSSPILRKREVNLHGEVVRWIASFDMISDHFDIGEFQIPYVDAFSLFKI